MVDIDPVSTLWKEKYHMRYSYQERTKQKETFLRLGNVGMYISLPLMFVGLIGFVVFDKSSFSFLASIGQMSLYLSGTSILVFSRIGWSQNRLIDLFFNQLCIVVAFTGYFLTFLSVQYDMPLFNIGYVLVVASFLMAWIGNRLQSAGEN